MASGGDAVPDVSKLFGEHYCCELAILTFAGKDASEEFNMMHPPEVKDKYSPDVVMDLINSIKGAPPFPWHKWHT